MVIEKQKYLVTKQIQRLTSAFSKYMANRRVKANYENKIAQVCEKNPHHEDKRLNSNVVIMNCLYLVAVAGAIAVDTFLLKTVLILLCFRLAIPILFAYVLPFILVVIELAISYIVNRRTRSREGGGMLEKIVPYLVLTVIIGLVMYGIQHEVLINIDYDKNQPFINAVFDFALDKVVLFLFSLFAHIIIILCADEIIDAVSFFNHKIQINTWKRTINRLEAEYTKQLTPMFTKEVAEYINIKNEYAKKFPNEKTDFDNFISKDIKQRANNELGRPVFTLTNTSDEGEQENHIKGNFIIHGEA